MFYWEPINWMPKSIPNLYIQTILCHLLDLRHRHPGPPSHRRGREGQIPIEHDEHKRHFQYSGGRRGARSAYNKHQVIKPKGERPHRSAYLHCRPLPEPLKGYAELFVEVLFLKHVKTVMSISWGYPLLYFCGPCIFFAKQYMFVVCSWKRVCSQKPWLISYAKHISQHLLFISIHFPVYAQSRECHTDNIKSNARVLDSLHFPLV